MRGPTLQRTQKFLLSRGLAFDEVHGRRCGNNLRGDPDGSYVVCTSAHCRRTKSKRGAQHHRCVLPEQMGRVSWTCRNCRKVELAE